MYVSLSPLWDLRGRIEKWQKPPLLGFRTSQSVNDRPVLCIDQKVAQAFHWQIFEVGIASPFWAEFADLSASSLEIFQVAVREQLGFSSYRIKSNYRYAFPFSASVTLLKFNKSQLTHIQIKLIRCHFLIHGKHVGDVEATHPRYVLVLLLYAN